MSDIIPEDKRDYINDILSRPLLARLATAAPVAGAPVTGDPTTMQPHVVPVWHYWDGESLYISAFASTRKLKEAARNPRIAVVVDGGGPPEPGATWGVLLEGSAEVIASPREYVVEMSKVIYTRYMGAEGVLAVEPQSWIHDAGNRIIRLKPEFVHAW